MSGPRVTVLLPVHNGMPYLDEAVRSILSQTYSGFELLAIDDGSTDGTLEALRAYRDPRVRIVVNERNFGLAETLNRGLSLSPGEYVARMDSDDVSLPDRLERQVRFMDQHPEIGACGTWARIVGVRRTGLLIRPPADPEEIRARLLFGSAMVHPSVMFRLPMLAGHDLRYDPRDAHAEDFGMWRRCSGHFPLANIPRVLIAYRVTKGSVSSTHALRQAESVRAICRDAVRRLGLEPSEEELEAHRRIGLSSSCGDRETLERAERWLRALREANALRRVYPEPVFSEVLGERWFTVCDATAHAGRWVWTVYRRSPLRLLAGPGAIRAGKFAVKCALGRAAVPPLRRDPV